jgi:hypothetical protein
MDYLSTCRISRQITILQRNPKRSSNRLTKKKMQLLLLSFEKSLCTRWNKNSSNLLKVFFSSQNRKKIERREEQNEADVDYLISGFLNTSSLLFEKVFIAH